MTDFAGEDRFHVHLDQGFHRAHLGHPDLHVARLDLRGLEFVLLLVLVVRGSTAAREGEGPERETGDDHDEALTTRTAPCLQHHELLIQIS